MIAYVYWKGSLSINCKIDNVSSILDGEIIGDSSCKFGGGSDYVILQNPIDKNIGEVIDLTGLEDERSYFLKGKEVWMQEKINKLNNVNTELNDRLKTLETDPPLVHQVSNANTLIDDLSQMMVEISTVNLA